MNEIGGNKFLLEFLALTKVADWKNMRTFAASFVLPWVSFRANIDRSLCCIRRELFHLACLASTVPFFFLPFSLWCPSFQGVLRQADFASLPPPASPPTRLDVFALLVQHFRQRDRLGRLLTALAYNPFAVGIGLDEDTAAFIDHTKKITVVGAGAITIVDASELSHSSIADTKEGKPVCMTNVRLHVLVDGGTFDLETRRAEAGAR